MAGQGAAGLGTARRGAAGLGAAGQGKARVAAALGKWMDDGAKKKPKQYGRKWCIKSQPKPKETKP